MTGWDVIWGAGVLLLLAAIWFFVYYWLTPQVAEPNGKARLTGVCGDVMEIRLVFQGGRMAQASPWSNGCAHSLNCVWAAVDLAKGKTPEQILDIDPAAIRKFVGGLPRDYWHCASLAADTLHAAVDDYMQTVVGVGSRKSETA